MLCMQMLTMLLSSLKVSTLELHPNLQLAAILNQLPINNSGLEVGPLQPPLRVVILVCSKTCIPSDLHTILWDLKAHQSRESYRAFLSHRYTLPHLPLWPP